MMKTKRKKETKKEKRTKKTKKTYEKKGKRCEGKGKKKKGKGKNVWMNTGRLKKQRQSQKSMSSRICSSDRTYRISQGLLP